MQVRAQRDVNAKQLLLILFKLKWQSRATTETFCICESCENPAHSNTAATTKSVFELNVSSLQYLLPMIVAALSKRFHVPSRPELPHPGHRKLWEGCLEEVQWGLGEGAYWVFAEGQKPHHGV